MSTRHLSKTTNLLAAFVLCAIVARTPEVPAQEKDSAPVLEPRALVRALQSGGHVIYFRHMATDQSQVDSNRIDLENCATQRNLSDKGRDQARSIGQSFARLGIKVSKVLSSPYCRCIETAKLGFGEPAIVPDLEFAISKSESEAKRLGVVLYKLLATRPPRGTNTVVIAHSANLKEAAAIWPQPEGAAHIFQPQDEGRFVHLGRIGPEEWDALVRLK
jgi:phosphohistidine phosphatase SixA